MGIFNDEFVDFVDRSHSRHPELSIEKVEYTLISMHQRALQSLTPFVFSSTGETDEELLPTINALKTKLNVDIPTHDVILGDPLWNDDAAIKEVTFSMPIPDDLKPDDEEDHSEEIMFEEDNTTVGVIPFPSIFSLL